MSKEPAFKAEQFLLPLPVCATRTGNVPPPGSAKEVERIMTLSLLPAMMDLKFQGWLTKHGIKPQLFDEPRLRGIYFLFHETTLVYIGQTTNLHNRIPAHHKDKMFDRVVFVPWAGDLDEAERRWITHFQPSFNIAGTEKAWKAVPASEYRKSWRGAAAYNAVQTLAELFSAYGSPNRKKAEDIVRRQVARLEKERTFHV